MSKRATGSGRPFKSCPCAPFVRRLHDMKPTLLGLLLLGLLSAAGCRTRYELTMSNTSSVTAYSKPKLVNGRYVFKDANGQETSVFQGRVRQIERK